MLPLLYSILVYDRSPLSFEHYGKMSAWVFQKQVLVLKVQVAFKLRLLLSQACRCLSTDHDWNLRQFYKYTAHHVSCLLLRSDKLCSLLALQDSCCKRLKSYMTAVNVLLQLQHCILHTDMLPIDPS